MKKIVRNILLAILGLVIIAGIGLSVFTGRQVFAGFTNITSREETVENIKEFEDKYNKLKDDYHVQSIMIDNPNSQTDVPAIYVKKEGNKDVAVLVHGLGGTKETNVDIMNLFLDLGYDVISYDQRNSGENMASYNTLGVLESYDTRAVIDYIAPFYKQSLNPGKLILWGESMGGITAIIASGRDETNIDYLILESPVSNGKDMLEMVMTDISNDQGIPLGYLMGSGDWYTRFALGFNFNDMDGNKWIANIDIPVLITHDSTDEVTPAYMAEDLYESINHGNKELITVDGYGHANLARKDPETYKEIVEGFLRKY